MFAPQYSELVEFTKPTFKHISSPGCKPTSTGWETDSHYLDEDLPSERSQLPSQCVDYLTHEWDDEDLALSWKAVSKHNESTLNCARLENASWRIWGKRRSKIPTLNPAELNWHKDNDITWLYGPLLTAPKARSAPVSKSSSFIGIVPTGIKPALKKRPSAYQVFNVPHPSCPSKPRIRFSPMVDQFIAIDSPNSANTCNSISVARMAPTVIKAEDPIRFTYFDEPLTKRSEQMLYDEDYDMFDPNMLINLEQSQELDPGHFVRRCFQAVNTTMEVVTWCRNLLL